MNSKYSFVSDLKQYFQQTRHIQSKVIRVVKESVSVLDTARLDVIVDDVDLGVYLQVRCDGGVFNLRRFLARTKSPSS